MVTSGNCPCYNLVHIAQYWGRCTRNGYAAKHRSLGNPQQVVAIVCSTVTSQTSPIPHHLFSGGPEDWGGPVSGRALGREIYLHLQILLRIHRKLHNNTAMRLDVSSSPLISVGQNLQPIRALTATGIDTLQISNPTPADHWPLHVGETR